MNYFIKNQLYVISKVVFSYICKVFSFAKLNVLFGGFGFLLGIIVIWILFVFSKRLYETF
jgi:hypothetical protein